MKQTKTELRKKTKERVENLVLNREDFLRREKIILEKIQSLDEFKKAKTILSYYPFAYEFDLTSLINLYPEKVWALPRPLGEGIMELCLINNLDDSLEQGKYGLMVPKTDCEAIQAEKLDLVLVPGLAFDRAGYRLGQGMGYYDRLLAKLPIHCVTIGVAHEEQIIDSMPVEQHDMKIGILICDKG